MNWEERLSRWADKLEVAGDKTVDFASAEIPEYVRELLAWEFWFNTMIAIPCFLICVVFYYSVYRIIKESFRIPNKSDRIDYYGTSALMLILALCSLAGFLSCSIRAAKVKIAPRVVIVEKIQGLARGHK